MSDEENIGVNILRRAGLQRRYRLPNGKWGTFYERPEGGLTEEEASAKDVADDAARQAAEDKRYVDEFNAKKEELLSGIVSQNESYMEESRKRIEESQKELDKLRAETAAKKEKTETTKEQTFMAGKKQSLRRKWRGGETIPWGSVLTGFAGLQEKTGEAGGKKSLLGM